MLENMLNYAPVTPRIDTKKLISVSSAAELLGITRAGIYKALKRKRLTTVDIDGVKFIKRSDLAKYTQSKSVGGRPRKK
jgi:excisionase family DNA binding protein